MSPHSDVSFLDAWYTEVVPESSGKWPWKTKGVPDLTQAAAVGPEFTLQATGLPSPS